MINKYPRPGSWKRIPKPEKDGLPNVGAPCVICEQNTLGILWIEYTMFRGDDEPVRLCHGCRTRRNDAALKTVEAL